MGSQRSNGIRTEETDSGIREVAGGIVTDHSVLMADVSLQVRCPHCDKRYFSPVEDYPAASVVACRGCGANMWLRAL